MLCCDSELMFSSLCSSRKTATIFCTKQVKIYDDCLLFSHALMNHPTGNPLLCGFRVSCGTHHSPLKFMETCKKSLDNGGVAGAVLKGLSKAFDCLNHELFHCKTTITAKSSWNTNAFLRFSGSFPFFVLVTGVEAASPRQTMLVAS